MVRSTPLTKPARAVSNSMPACSTVVSSAACGSTLVRSSWYAPSRSRSSRTGSMLVGRPARRARDDGVEQAEGCGTCRRSSSVANAASRPVIPRSRSSRGQGEVGVRVAFGDRAQHVECGPAGGIERLAASPGGAVRAVCSRLARAPSRPGGRRAPSRGRHRLLARRLDPVQPHRVRCGADEHAVASTRITPGGNDSRPVSDDRTELDPEVADHRPRARIGRDGADAPVDDVRGQIPAHPAPARR